MKVRDEVLEKELAEGYYRLKEEVTARIIKAWDKEGEGCFAEFLLQRFASFWIGKVREN